MTPKATNTRYTRMMTVKAKFNPPSEAEIALCAFAIYAEENPQRAIQLWREAEAQLMAARQHDAGLFRTQRTFTHN